MKLVLIALSLLFSGRYSHAQDYRLAPDASREDVEFLDQWHEPWGKGHVSAAEAFKPLLEEMLKDPFTREYWNEAAAILKPRGISSPLEIIQFCEDRGDGADGGYDAGVSIQSVGLKGLPDVIWKTTDVFEGEPFKVFTHETDFFVFTFYAKIPTICTNSDESRLAAYDIFTHELVHFVKSNPIAPHLRTIELSSYDGFIDDSIMAAGSEYDAYQVGIKALARLVKRHGVINPADPYDFIDDAGEVADEPGYRAYVYKMYDGFYRQDLVRNSVLAGVRSYSSLKLWLLDLGMEKAKSLGDEALGRRYDQEKRRIEPFLRISAPQNHRVQAQALE